MRPNSSKINPCKQVGLLLCLLFSLSAVAQEICDNGIDDDGDGLVDLNDLDDCSCTTGSAFLDIIPNPSFEDIDCCPEFFEDTGDFECLPEWEPGTFGTADQLNTCGFTTEGLPLPIPDGEGAVGTAAGVAEVDLGFGTTFLEYVSTCLTEPLEATTEYSLNFFVAATVLDEFGNSFPIDFNDAEITLYGLPVCFDVAPTFGCPEEFGWVPLGSTNYTPENEWEELTMELEVDEPFAAIALGLSCDLDDSYTVDLTPGNIFVPYFYFDDLSLFEGSGASPGPVDLAYSDCNESATLTAPAGDFSYQWYLEGVAILGETSSVLTIDVDGQTEGTYSVVLTNPNGNCALESVEVEVLENDLIIGGEPTTGCPPLTVNFDSANTPGGLILEWFIDGQIFEGEFVDYTFTNPGTYPISAQYVDANGCIFEAEFDEPIVVADNPTLTPQFNVTGNCAPFTIDLSVTEISSGCTWVLDDGTEIANDCNATYIYNGEVDFTVNVSSVSDGCEALGSAIIPISVATTINYSIEGELEFCEGESSVLTASPASNTYTWNGTETGLDFEVDAAGEYTLDIVDSEGCEFSDTFTVSTIGNPNTSLPPSITACLGVPLNFSVFANGNQFNIDTLTSSTAIEQGGTVFINITNECRRILREVEVIREDCDCKVFIPNAFTPNGDGKNDLFKPQINCELSEYEFVIYNRWGQEIFKTTNPDVAWNGDSGDQDFYSPSAVFVYTLRYDGALNPIAEPVELTGRVAIIR